MTMTRIHVLFSCVLAKIGGGWHERMIFLWMKMKRGMMLGIYDTFRSLDDMVLREGGCVSLRYECGNVMGI